MSIPAPYSEVYLAGDGVTTVFAFGTNFKPISAGLVKCSVYLQDGYEVIPTYTVDMEGKFITISALTLPDSTVLTAPPAGSTVRIYRDMPEEQDITASQLQAFTAKQLEVALDAIVAMIQEVSYTTDHKTVRLTEPQRDIALQELGALEDEHLIYWDNTARKLVVTNYPQKDVVRCVNGLFFRLRTDPDTQEPYLQWSTDESDWHSINIDEVELQAQGAYALAGDAYTLAYATSGELNTHKGDHSNPHETSLANLTDTDLSDAESGQFLWFDGIKWKAVYSTATVSWGGILGDILDQADLQDEFDTKVSKSGDTMTGALSILRTSSSNTPLITIGNGTASSRRWNFLPSYNATSLSVYSGTSETGGYRFTLNGFVPASNNVRDLGSSSLKWKAVYAGILNNGANLVIPTKGGTLATMADVELAARSGTQLTEQGVWYAKMYAATVAPAAENGTNYADFSQVDGKGNPIIVTYNRVNGAWVQDKTITPPAEYDGYVPVTSKIWDIVEQSGQQGGKVLWSHNQKTFTPSPLIISFEDIEVTGDSTVVMPQNPGANQIVNKDYVDEAIASIPTPTVDVTQSIDVEIVGTLTITDNSVVSGFSANNYLKLPGVFELGSSDTSSFEIGAAFIGGNIVHGEANVLLSGQQINSTLFAGLSISFGSSSDRKLRVQIRGSGATQTIVGTTDLGTEKVYIKLQYDGANYNLLLSNDGSTYTQDTTVAATQLATPAVFCIAHGGSSTVSTVDLSGCYIKKNGVIIWQGMDAPGLHQRVAKGHEVIAFQAPTAGNNYTWYRKYADGWVEQGGLVRSNSGTTVSVVYPVAFADANYTLTIGLITTKDTAVGIQWAGAQTKSSTGCEIRVDSEMSKDWMAAGMAA